MPMRSAALRRGINAPERSPDVNVCSIHGHNEVSMTLAPKAPKAPSAQAESSSKLSFVEEYRYGVTGQQVNGYSANTEKVR